MAFEAGRFSHPEFILVTGLIAFVASTTIGCAMGENRKPHWQETEVAQAEYEWLAALNTAKVDTIARILAEDFSRPSPDSGDFVTKQELLLFYRSHLSPLPAGENRRIEGLSVRVYGDVALARGLVVTRNAEGTVVRKLLFTDVFRRRDSQWQATSAQENEVTLPR